MSPDIFFTAEHVDGVLVVAPKRRGGGFIEEESRDEWPDIFELIEQDQTLGVVLDMHAIDYFGSTMMELMVAMLRRGRKRGVGVALCNLSEAGRGILEIARLDQLFSIYGSRDEAVDHFRASDS